MQPLDDPSVYAQLDPSGMGRFIEAMPEHCAEGYAAARGFTLPRDYRRAERVLVAGMGSSALAGDVAAALQSFNRGTPVDVVRDYTPEFEVDRRTLFIASSFSGNTEEALSALDYAMIRGARCLAITTGGDLAQLAEARGAPVLTFSFDGPPRSSVGWSIFALLGILQGLELAPARDAGGAIDELHKLGEAIHPNTPVDGNPAKQLASKIGDRAALIVGAQHLRPAARRWKTQVAENAKSWAFAEEVPELHHNTIEGLRKPDPGAVFVVLLRSTLYYQRIADRFKLTAEVLAREGVPFEQPEARSESALAQVMTAILLGDYFSYYLGLLRGVDPSPMPNIEWIKARLSD